MVHICDTEYTEFEGDYDVILIENETYMHYFDAKFIAFLHFFFFHNLSKNAKYHHSIVSQQVFIQSSIISYGVTQRALTK